MSATVAPERKNDRPRTKRTKTAHVEDAKIAEQSQLGSLPLELLAEILSYVTPRDILAVARTSKFFCATLVTNPASKFIWKQARTRYEPAIPEPTPNFTEPAYAALLFDAGPCENCNKKTQSMYASFTMRVRFCENEYGARRCREVWTSSKARSLLVTGYEHERYTSLLQWIPRMEYANYGYPRTAHASDPPTEAVGVLVRKADWAQAIDEYNKAALSPVTMTKYIEEKNVAVKRQHVIMKLAKDLIRWRNGVTVRQKNAFDSNLELARTVAIENNWAVWDLLSTEAFGTLYRNKNKSLECISRDELKRLEPAIIAQIERMVKTRARRKDENGYRERRKNVEVLYDELKQSAADNAPLPPLPDFRKLPMVQRIQYKPDNAPSAAVAKELGSSKLATQLVVEEVAQWRTDARTALGTVLGFDAWEPDRPGQLHPVDRLTARFRCKKCNDKGRLKGWENVSLDFYGTCRHRCKATKRERAKETWQAENFVPDSTAIEVVERLLARLECAADDERSIKTVAGLGSRIICLSCETHIRMDFPTLLRHCYRHERMQFDILPGQPSVDEKPIERGLRAKLVAPTAEAERQRRIYFCRHCPSPGSTRETLGATAGDLSGSVPGEPNSACTLQPSSDVGSVAEKAADTRPSKPARRAGAAKGSGPKALNFDGLRSHAKDKHGIEWIGDEDFYRVLPDSTPVTKTKA